MSTLSEIYLQETSAGECGDPGQKSPSPENLQETGLNTDYDLPSPPHVSVFSKEHNNKRKFEQMQGAQQEVEELEEELAQLQAKGKKTKPLAKDWSPTLKKKINALRGKIGRKKKSIQNEEKKSAIGPQSSDLDMAIAALVDKAFLSAGERTELKKLKERKKKQIQRNKETESQRLERLQKKKSYQKDQRCQETESQRLDRLQKQKDCQEDLRCQETESQRLERLQKDKDYHTDQRCQETESQRLERLQKDKDYQKDRRGNETPHQKKKRNRKESDKKMYKRRAGTKITRLEKFRKQVRFGPVYPCITCHQLMYQHQVKIFDTDMVNFIKAKCSDTIVDNSISYIPETFYMTITEEKIDSEEGKCDRITMVSGGSEKERCCFLCKVCFSHLNKGALPPKAAANCLRVVDVPEDVKLRSYLEEALLARTLLFMKIFSLKSSLMPAIKDRCVVIPIDCVDVLNTVQSLPRLPSESGIIDIQWKRRTGQKNAHLQAKVEPARIFRALEFLRASGNEHYTDTDSREDYEERCLAEDPDGYDLLFGSNRDEEQGGQGGLRVTFLPDGTAETILELEPFCELQREQVHRRH